MKWKERLEDARKQISQEGKEATDEEAVAMALSTYHPIKRLVYEYKLARGCQYGDKCTLSEEDKKNYHCPSYYDMASDVEEEENAWKGEHYKVYGRDDDDDDDVEWGNEGLDADGSSSKSEHLGNVYAPAAEEMEEDVEEDDDDEDIRGMISFSEDVVKQDDHLEVGDDGSYRPSRKELEDTGIYFRDESDKFFFGKNSPRPGLIRIVSCFMVGCIEVWDDLLLGQQEYLCEEMQKMLDSREVMHAGCHQDLDASR